MTALIPGAGPPPTRIASAPALIGRSVPSRVFVAMALLLQATPAYRARPALTANFRRERRAGGGRALPKAQALRTTGADLAVRFPSDSERLPENRGSERG